MSKLTKKDLKFQPNGWVIISYRDEENILRKAWFDDTNIAWNHVELLKKMGIEDIFVN